MFVTSPEEGDLFSAKPTSQKKPVRAAMVHRRKLSVLICWSYVYIQLATLLSSLLSLSLLFLFLSPCLLPPFPLSYVLPFLSLSPTFLPFSLFPTSLPSLPRTSLPLSLLPSFPLPYVLPFLSLFPTFPPFSLSLLPFLSPSLPSLCLYMYLSYFPSTFLPPPCSRK